MDTLGERRCALEGVPAEESAAFATALDEVVSPMASPRYVLPRWVLQEPVDNADGLRVAFGRLRPDGEVWHSVPTVLGTTGRRAQAFAAAWDRWVGEGRRSTPAARRARVSWSRPGGATRSPRRRCCGPAGADAQPMSMRSITQCFWTRTMISRSRRSPPLSSRAAAPFFA